MLTLRPRRLSTPSTASVIGLRKCPWTSNRIGKFRLLRVLQALESHVRVQTSLLGRTNQQPSIILRVMPIVHVTSESRLIDTHSLDIPHF